MRAALTVAGCAAFGLAWFGVIIGAGLLLSWAAR
jgi:hypothetical protein